MCLHLQIVFRVIHVPYAHVFTQGIWMQAFRGALRSTGCCMFNKACDTTASGVAPARPLEAYKVNECVVPQRSNAFLFFLGGKLDG